MQDHLHQHVVFARERKLPGDELVQHHAHGEDIAAPVDHLVAQPLRRHVGHRADDVSRPRQADVLAAPLQARNAEVQQLGLAVRLHEDVGRLHVAMNDVVGVRVPQRRAGLLDDAQPVHHGERHVARDDLVQRIALHALHHDVGNPVVFAEIVDRHDVGVIEPAGLAAFFIESRQHLAVAGHSLGEGFDGHFAPDLLVHRAIDHAHAAAPQHFDHVVLADALEIGCLVVVLVQVALCVPQFLVCSSQFLVRTAQFSVVSHPFSATRALSS